MRIIGQIPLRTWTASDESRPNFLFIEKQNTGFVEDVPR